MSHHLHPRRAASGAVRVRAAGRLASWRGGEPAIDRGFLAS